MQIGERINEAIYTLSRFVHKNRLIKKQLSKNRLTRLLCMLVTKMVMSGYLVSGH